MAEATCTASQPHSPRVSKNKTEAQEGQKFEGGIPEPDPHTPPSLAGGSRSMASNSGNFNLAPSVPTWTTPGQPKLPIELILEVITHMESPVRFCRVSRSVLRGILPWIYRRLQIDSVKQLVSLLLIVKIGPWYDVEDLRILERAMPAVILKSRNLTHVTLNLDCPLAPWLGRQVFVMTTHLDLRFSRAEDLENHEGLVGDLKAIPCLTHLAIRCPTKSDGFKAQLTGGLDHLQALVITHCSREGFLVTAGVCIHIYDTRAPDLWTRVTALTVRINNYKKALLGIGLASNEAELVAFFKKIKDYPRQLQAQMFRLLDQYEGDDISYSATQQGDRMKPYREDSDDDSEDDSEDGS
ncbi:hypothetical protein B0H14DRAFT_2620879 [Mycena olivaceomarginata]|nr:hypothetical protein B0H14DRAFT_2620879 [Mycena olivaceomarginata]